MWFANRPPLLFRYRPAVVEAKRVEGNFDELMDWTDGAIMWLDFSPGDHIVKAADGEFSVFSPDAFATTFESLVSVVAE